MKRALILAAVFVAGWVGCYLSIVLSLVVAVGGEKGKNR